MPPHATTDFFDCDECATLHYHRSIPTKPLAPKARRTVTFAPYDEVQEMIHINDLKKTTDIKTLWFTVNEYTAMRSDMTKTVHDYECGHGLNENEQCIRGLEGKTTFERRSRKEQILSAVYAVLDEQELQRHEGMNDPELLADIYYNTSCSSQVLAEEIGRQTREDIFGQK